MHRPVRPPARCTGKVRRLLRPRSRLGLVSSNKPSYNEVPPEVFLYCCVLFSMPVRFKCRVWPPPPSPPPPPPRPPRPLGFVSSCSLACDGGCVRVLLMPYVLTAQVAINEGAMDSWHCVRTTRRIGRRKFPSCRESARGHCWVCSSLLETTQRISDLSVR